MQQRCKTDADHKAKFTIGVQCSCSCGWRSSMWLGKGAKSNASAEWHGHMYKCDQAKEAA